MVQEVTEPQVAQALSRARAAQGQRQELSVALERLLDAAHAMLDGVIILNRLNAIEWLNADSEWRDERPGPLWQRARAGK